MKKLLLVLLITLSLNAFTQQNDFTWHTDVNQAVNLSFELEKPIYFFFTGSDWCGWCKRLVAEVFTKEEFKTWAKNNIILVELDFPRRKPMSDELRKQNTELGNIFRVRGYPSGYFVTPERIDNEKVSFQQLGMQGYVAGGAKAWISQANKILNNK